jgi:hypothetical protein
MEEAEGECCPRCKAARTGASAPSEVGGDEVQEEPDRPEAVREDTGFEHWKHLIQRAPERGAAEESEMLQGGRPPSCRENDPTLFGHEVGPQPGHPAPAARPQEQELLPLPKRAPVKPAIGKGGNQAEGPETCQKGQRGTVDTTEFRSSDAKRGEFEKIPF